MTMHLLFLTLMFSFLYHCQDLYRNGLYAWVTRWVFYKMQELLTLREHMGSPPALCWGLCCQTFSFCDVLLCCFMFWFPWCDVRCDFNIKLNFMLPPAVCRRVHVLFTLCVFVCLFWCKTHNILPLPCIDYIIQHILTCDVPLCSRIWINFSFFLNMKHNTIFF